MTIKGETVKHGSEAAPTGSGAVVEPSGFGARTRHRVRKIIGARESTLAAVVILLVIYLSWASPYFFTVGNLTVVGRQIALALLISTGMTFVILIGGIDLSVGSVVALVSVLTGEFMVTAGMPPAVAVILALLGGALVGLTNGLINAFWGLPSFVVTLGMLAVARGLALGITSGSTISGFPPGFLNLGQGVTSSESRSRSGWLRSSRSLRISCSAERRSAATCTSWARTSKQPSFPESASGGSRSPSS